MTETSLPWTGAVTGDATLAPYSADQWSDMFRKLHLDNRAKSGVVRGYLDEFAASGTTSPVTIASGGAFVDGIFYESDANETFALVAPAVNPRIDRIVLRKDTANQTVRLTVITGAEAASPSPPAITQVNDNTWDLRLWQAWIDTAGNITLFDEFNWAHSPLGFDVGLQQGRLSLVYNSSVPLVNLEDWAPNSTDAVNDTITYASEAPWNTGQAVQISATTNGLTQDQIYYVRTADNLTYSFHNTLHDAKRNLNKVNITGNIEPSTLYSGAVYLTRHNGDSYDVYDSNYGWTRLRIPEDGLLLDITDRATYTASENFDVFVTEDGTLEALIWTDSTTRATDVEKKDGVYVKSTDDTRRLLGTIRTTATAGRVDDQEEERGIANIFNVMPRYFYNTKFSSHNYNGAIRLWDNDATLYCGVVLPLDESPVFLSYGHDAGPTNGATTQAEVIADADTGTTYGASSATGADANQYNASVGFVYYENPIVSLGAGYHTMGASEAGNHANSKFIVLFIQGHILG